MKGYGRSYQTYANHSGYLPEGLNDAAIPCYPPLLLRCCLIWLRMNRVIRDRLGRFAPCSSIAFNSFLPSALTNVTSDRSTRTGIANPSLRNSLQLRSSSGTQGPLSLPTSLSVCGSDSRTSVILSMLFYLRSRIRGCARETTWDRSSPWQGTLHHILNVSVPERGNDE